MSQLSLFAIEVGICLLASGLLLAVLTRLLRRLLVDACRTIERANFWVVYSAAAMLIVPLLAVVVLGRSTDSAEPTLAFYKAALSSALLGLFTALAVLGIRKSPAPSLVQGPSGRQAAPATRLRFPRTPPTVSAVFHLRAHRGTPCTVRAMVESSATASRHVWHGVAH